MRFLPLLLILALVAGPAAGERFYKWTDAEGNVHYTDEPPAQGAYQVMDPAASGGDRAGPTSAERAQAWRERQKEATAKEAEREAALAEQRRAEKQREENCRRAREKARVLEQNTRILMPPEEEGGEPVRMSDDERLRRLEEAREQVREFCDNG